MTASSGTSQAMSWLSDGTLRWRPAQFNWPDNMRVAVWPVVNIEEYPVGGSGPSPQPHLARGLDIANYGWRAYGNEAGVFRLMELISEVSMPCTAAVNSSICSTHPAVIDSILSSGWDIIGHGRDNVTRQYDMSRVTEEALVKDAIQSLESRTGKTIKGWLTPGFDISESTFDILREMGITYTADLSFSDRPAWIDTRSGPLLTIPYGLETNDISLILNMHYTAAEYAHAITKHVGQLATEPTESVVGLGLHPFIMGQPGRIGALKECVRSLRSIPGVWIATGSQILEHCQQK